jgi:Tfp pilus assembly protein PilV
MTINGFALLEAMIAAFLLAFGILGITSMHLWALNRIQDSYFQALATNQISNVMEQFDTGDHDCILWQTTSKALLPRSKANCNKASFSLCWQAKNHPEQCAKLKF